MDMKAIDREELSIYGRRILQTMGETGQPPERGALLVNTGTEEFLQVLEKEYLIPIAAARLGSTFKLVQAPFGGGKTQFLHAFREVAWRQGFFTSLVSVSPKSCPFDDLAQIYRAVVKQIQMPPEDKGVALETGLCDVLRAQIRLRQEEEGKDGLNAWLKEELSHAKVDNHAYRRAVYAFLSAVIDCDLEKEALLEDYLLGSDIPGSELRPLGVRDHLEERNAFSFLKSLVQVLHLLGIPGLVLLFDEIDRVMSLTVRRRRVIADNLREMIDSCGRSDLPGLIFLYAVPPEFMTILVPEYPALEQRLRGARQFSQTSPMSPILDLDRLPMDSEELLESIGLRLLDVYQVVYPGSVDQELQKKNIKKLAKYMAGSQLESGARRTFVKAMVQLLTEQDRGEESLVENMAEYIQATQKMPELDGEELF